MDLQGVRKGDQKRVMEGILGLQASYWIIEYYRRLELKRNELGRQPIPKVPLTPDTVRVANTTAALSMS